MNINIKKIAKMLAIASWIDKDLHHSEILDLEYTKIMGKKISKEEWESILNEAKNLNEDDFFNIAETITDKKIQKEVFDKTINIIFSDTHLHPKEDLLLKKLSIMWKINPLDTI